MCDYSLAEFNNRLAKEGEQLETYRFRTGSIGLASVSEINALKAWHRARAQTGFFTKVKQALRPTVEPKVCAICIPPGATLSITRKGVTEEVKFDHLSENPYSYRDAIRYNNGKALSLQYFAEGLSVTVISLGSSAEQEIPFQESAILVPAPVFERSPATAGTLRRNRRNRLSPSFD